MGKRGLLQVVNIKITKLWQDVGFNGLVETAVVDGPALNSEFDTHHHIGLRCIIYVCCPCCVELFLFFLTFTELLCLDCCY